MYESPRRCTRAPDECTRAPDECTRAPDECTTLDECTRAPDERTSAKDECTRALDELIEPLITTTPLMNETIWSETTIKSKKSSLSDELGGRMPMRGWSIYILAQCLRVRQKFRTYWQVLYILCIQIMIVELTRSNFAGFQNSNFQCQCCEH